MNLFRLNQGLQQFHIWDEVVQSVQNTRDSIAEMVRGQLFLGKKPDGNEMPPYSPWYADIKSKLSGIAGITDRRTLYLTGNFWKSIEVDVDTEKFVLKSTDSKADKIHKREGDVLGMTTDSKEEYVRNYFFPELKERIYHGTGIQI